MESTTTTTSATGEPCGTTEREPEGAPEVVQEAPPALPVGRHTVALAHLLVVPEYQIRKSTIPGVVAQYAGLLRGGVELPPVLAGRINGTLVLLDGFHRAEAHRKVGRLEIEVEVVDTTPREARWLAARGNLTHGLQLKPRERREAFRAFIRAGQHLDERRRIMSLREMARASCVGSHNTVRSWLKEFPHVLRAMASENRRGPGVVGRLPGRSFEEMAEDGITQAVAAGRAITCEFSRGRLALALRQAAEEMERGEPAPIITESRQKEPEAHCRF